ncbi:MAG: hypothetical protein ETSY1_05625 [Candidatus Entotheonella factor]|uniref:Sulfotransferase domain-containing protein n=1 Tax=Entotheonella factor TaxID=1429438 RepID=W4LVH5_ENTF1|nr:MAG: hypothetical protein ETSY1_05625 [Candidatus Entotheonella factor]
MKYRLLRAANIERIHIVGASRSGTTMLCYAMACFDRTLLHDRETSVWNYPTLSGSLGLFANRIGQSDKLFLVTKRGANWWRRERLERLASFVRRYEIFLIHIIRDPRDVLSSHHPLRQRQFYVEPDQWEQSIKGASWLWQQLADYPGKLVLKYEDIVQDPQGTQALLCQQTGLQLRHGVTSWARLKENVEATQGLGDMVSYMHQLRNFDPASIGKWRTNPDAVAHLEQLCHASPYGVLLNEFMRMYGYE